MSDKPIVFEINGKRTLPLHVIHFRAPEGGIPAMSSAKCKILYEEPTYEEPEYVFDGETMGGACSSFDSSIRYIKDWIRHASALHYFYQFQDDQESKMIINFHAHTEIVSAIFDSKIGLDTTPFWDVSRETLSFKEVNMKYRANPEPEAVWTEYADKSQKIWERLSAALHSSDILVRRAVNLLKLKKFETEVITPTTKAGSNSQSTEAEVAIFYSYCHRDEELRDELEKHLAVLKREGFIAQWHDRKLEAGDDWKTGIDKNLASASVILLLVSSDFLASDYCYEVEMKRALERHEQKSASVVPIILRSCDWSSAPFGKLQALPKDAMAVTSWSNRDEAFTDVAKNLRRLIESIQNERESR